jgi:hypothetical protein
MCNPHTPTSTTACEHIRINHSLIRLLDVVAMGKDKRGEGRCSKSGNDNEATLVLVYFDMPLMPGLGGGKHMTATAHVSKCSL